MIDFRWASPTADDAEVIPVMAQRAAARLLPASAGSSCNTNNFKMAEAALTNGAVPLSASDMSSAATQAMVTYLRLEADLADEKARRLRAQAAELSERFGITEAMQSQYEMDPEELPPVDENGIPKYKGKKRGRKPKPRKRQHNPNRRKRQHTAYTLFVKEIYPNVKAQHPELQSKDVISIVAKQWNKSLTPEEKQEWKLRAKATHEDSDFMESNGDAYEGGELAINDSGEGDAIAADAAYQQTVASMDDDDDDLENENEDDEEDDEEEIEEEDDEESEELPPPRRRRGRPKKARN